MKQTSSVSKMSLLRQGMSTADATTKFSSWNPRQQIEPNFNGHASWRLALLKSDTSVLPLEFPLAGRHTSKYLFTICCYNPAYLWGTLPLPHIRDSIRERGLDAEVEQFNDNIEVHLDDEMERTSSASELLAHHIGQSRSIETSILFFMGVKMSNPPMIPSMCLRRI